MNRQEILSGMNWILLIKKRSGDFFCKLLGWTPKEMDAGEFGTYTIFQKDGQDVAGMMNPTPGSSTKQSRWANLYCR